uniref:Putative VQ motif-containing protein n=1 Tax=Davidia involucrata TaxID=16924 RepID=A0A5B7BGG1_DAVIN
MSEWMQSYSYQQSICREAESPAGGLSEYATTDNMLSSPPGDDSSATSASAGASAAAGGGGGGQLNPKGGSVSKPIRRRSRASRRTPTTLLNADTSNFRALVQQFTGCSNAPSSSIGTRRSGPINLNFGLLTNTQQQHVLDATSFGYNQQLQEQQQMYQQQQQQSSFSFNNNNNASHDVFLSANINQTMDNFVMGNIIPPHHELAGDFSSYGKGGDGYFF